MEKVLFLGAFFFAYTVQAITGFAGNIFAMPVGTTLLGLNSTVSILNAMGFFACGLLALMNIKHVNWRELGKILAVMVVFMMVGIWLDTIMPLHILLKIYGAVIVVIGAKNLLFKRQKFLPEWALWVILALAGIIQGMFVSGGALLVIYAVQKLRDQQEFRITLSMTWTVLNFIYACIAFQQGHFTGDVLQIILMCIPLAVIATVLGSKLQKKISRERFLKLVYVMLLLIGIVLVVTS
ncbi:MAG: sulfite exporter TauE/SafE family protein [Gordonibacter sp.]|uniref:sulfite exporter TauE/SafE family protein n=1 Tax=Gordonibacter sp. TaxID=1968902 RepID=UPI002FC98251